MDLAQMVEAPCLPSQIDPNAQFSVVQASVDMIQYLIDRMEGLTKQ